MLIEQRFPKVYYQDALTSDLYVPHAQRVLRLCSQGCNWERMRLLHNVSCSLSSAARFASAEQALSELLEISAIENGKEHPYTLGHRCNLAVQICAAGRWKEAEQLLFRSIETTRRVLGEYHRIPLRNVAVLAMLASLQDKQDKSPCLLAFSLATIMQAIAGETHLDTLFTVSILAEVIRASDAGNPFLLELATDEAVRIECGLDRGVPFDSLSTICQLSPALWTQERQKDAKDIDKQAEDAKLKELDSDHALSFYSMRISAIEQWLQYKNNSAIVKMEESIENMKAAWGSDHQDFIEDSEIILRSWRIQIL